MASFIEDEYDLFQKIRKEKERKRSEGLCYSCHFLKFFHLKIKGKCTPLINAILS